MKKTQEQKDEEAAKKAREESARHQYQKERYAFVVKSAIAQIGVCEKIVNFVESLDAKEEAFDISNLNEYMMIKVRSLKDLTKVRKTLKRFIEGYSDKVASVWQYTSEAGCATYTIYSRGERVAWVQIWLVMPLETFPKLKEGCGFKKVEKEQEIKAEVKKIVNWEYSCSKKEGQE